VLTNADVLDLSQHVLQATARAAQHGVHDGHQPTALIYEIPYVRCLSAQETWQATWPGSSVPTNQRRGLLYVLCRKSFLFALLRPAEIKKFEEWVNVFGPYIGPVDSLDVVLPVHRSRLPKTIMAEENSGWTFSIIRFSTYYNEDDIKSPPLTYLDLERVPRIKYKEPRDVNATELKVELTVTNQEEADRAMSQ